MLLGPQPGINPRINPGTCLLSHRRHFSGNFPGPTCSVKGAYDWLFDMSVKRHRGRGLANESCYLFQTFSRQSDVWLRDTRLKMRLAHSWRMQTDVISFRQTLISCVERLRRTDGLVIDYGVVTSHQSDSCLIICVMFWSLHHLVFHNRSDPAWTSALIDILIAF